MKEEPSMKEELRALLDKWQAKFDQMEEDVRGGMLKPRKQLDVMAQQEVLEELLGELEQLLPSVQPPESGTTDAGSQQ